MFDRCFCYALTSVLSSFAKRDYCFTLFFSACLVTVRAL